MIHPRHTLPAASLFFGKTKPMMIFHARSIKWPIFVIVPLAVLVLPAQADQEPSTSPPAFSDLSPEQKRIILHKVAPPPVAQRDAPYSTPMYYLPYKGYQAGFGSMELDQTGNFVLDCNRRDIT
jgi:hypothetical protein